MVNVFKRYLKEIKFVEVIENNLQKRITCQRIFRVISVEKFLCPLLLDKNTKYRNFLLHFFLKAKIQKKKKRRIITYRQKCKRVSFLYFIFKEKYQKILFLIPLLLIKIQIKKEKKKKRVLFSYFLKYKNIKDFIF